LRYHYVVSNIVLFALLQVHRNQQIVVLVPWLCGSVNLTANENIHHEEERTSFDCCSARFCWSRHQPGYVQGGQEVGRGYLLLGIHVRRILAQQFPFGLFHAGIPFCTVPVALTGAVQLRADEISSCCYTVNEHNHPS
jgi:hypothetical protein